MLSASEISRSAASQITTPDSRNSNAVARKRRDAFDLAVSVVVLLVGGLSGDAHRGVGHHGGAEIDQRVARFR